MPIDNPKRGERYLHNGNTVWIEHRINTLKALVCDNEGRELTDNYFEVRISELKPLNKVRGVIQSKPKALIEAKREFKAELNRVSPAKKKADKIYNAVRKVYLDNHALCEAKILGCLKVANQIHHKKGKVGKDYYDIHTFLAVCSNCHNWIENNVTKAKELGFSVDRL